MIFPIKKRMNAELFVDWMAALYIGQSQIRDKTKKGYGHILCKNFKETLFAKKCGNEGLCVNLILKWDQWKCDRIQNSNVEIYCNTQAHCTIRCHLTAFVFFMVCNPWYQDTHVENVIYMRGHLIIEIICYVLKNKKRWFSRWSWFDELWLIYLINRRDKNDIRLWKLKPDIKKYSLG